MPEPRPSRPVMRDYGISADERGLLPWSWAVEQLERARNFFLATRWPDGRPHVMPVWAIWHADTLWFSSGTHSRKTRNLLADPRCTATTEDALNPVVLEGIAERLTERADLELLLSLENAKYDTSYGLDMLDPATSRAFRLRPRWVFGLRSEAFSESPTRWILAP